MNFLDNGPKGVAHLREMMMAIAILLDERLEITADEMQRAHMKARSELEQLNADARENILAKESPVMRAFWEKMFDIARKGE